MLSCPDTWVMLFFLSYNVRLWMRPCQLSCYSVHAAVCTQTSGPHIGPCLLNSGSGGISLVWANPYGQVDFLCLQRCYIFHWLLSNRQWRNSFMAAIMEHPWTQGEMARIILKQSFFLFAIIMQITAATQPGVIRCPALTKSITFRQEAPSAP